MLAKSSRVRRTILDALWRGTWATRLRIVSGLVLMLYAFFHFLNIAAGLVSPTWMDVIQEIRQEVTRSAVGTIVIYGAALTHVVLALGKLALRRSLRMPLSEALQLALGLLIPFVLIDHVLFTRAGHEIYGVDDRYPYLISLIWQTDDGIMQNLLLFAVWIHGCIGVHFWLRTQDWWNRHLPALAAFATMVPVLAMLGYVTEGRRVALEYNLKTGIGRLLQEHNFPPPEGIAQLLAMSNRAFYSFVAVLVLVAGIYAVRKFITARASVRIHYVNGPEVSAPKGLTLLQMSKTTGVPHTALCGGRGRCTTCRVVVEAGLDSLPPPGPAEERSLRAVNAASNTRLACMIEPKSPLTVFRVFEPDGRRARAHATQGQEKRLAILFLDMRGFTARTTGNCLMTLSFC